MTTRISRREAMQRLSLTVVGPLLVGESRAQPKEPRWKTAIGLNGFMSSARKYKKNYPIEEVLAFAAHNGFEGVELVRGWPAGDYPPVADPERVKTLRGLYGRHGLRIFSLQLSAGPASDADAAVRQKWLEEFRDRVQLAKQLGCDHVGLWPGGKLKGQTVDEAIACLTQSFHEAGKIAADHGIVACFEIEPVFVFNTVEHFMRILEGANHPNLKGIYDPSHFDQMNGRTCKPEELLQRVGVKNIGYVQFCDTDGTCRDGGTSTHLGCGDGRTDCAKGLRILKEGGFRGWLMVDAWEVPDPYDACLKCKRAFDQAWQS